MIIERLRAAIVLRVALALLAAVPLSSQEEDRTYFSLSSDQTFASGTKPTIDLSAYGVGAVTIRVYRIKDAVQFMRQIADAHQFGGTYPKPQGKLSLLERLHEWKRSLRRDIRYNLRHQFTESPRAHLGGWKARTR